MYVSFFDSTSHLFNISSIGRGAWEEWTHLFNAVIEDKQYDTIYVNEPLW